MSKRFSLSKILVIRFLWSGESSSDSVLVFLGNFFDSGGSLYYGYLLGWRASRGAGRERGKVHVGGAGRGHVSFLSAAETTSFFEAFVLFLRSKFLWSFIDVDVHGIGVPGGSASSGGGGMESDGGSG